MFFFARDVNEELPVEKIELDLEVRHAVTGKHNSKGWQVIPCQGWNLLDGCDGVGSWSDFCFFFKNNCFLTC